MDVLLAKQRTEEWEEFAARMADPSLHDGDCFHRFRETASRTWETWRGRRERAASAKQTQDLSLWARACEAEPTWEFNDANCGCRHSTGRCGCRKGTQ